MSRPFSSADEFKGDVIVSGSFMGASKEHRTWTDKTTGQERCLDLDCIFINSSSWGMCVCRCYNPKFDITSFKIGDSVCFPVDKFEKENGLKSFIIRI